jgi:hypothetical protein
MPNILEHTHLYLTVFNLDPQYGPELNYRNSILPYQINITELNKYPCLNC